MARTGHQVRQARYRLQSRRRSQRQRCLATTFIRHALGEGHPDRWTFAPGQLEVLQEAKDKAKSEGLWNFFLPDAQTGEGLSNLDYAYIAIELGKNPLAAEVMNCSAPDTGNMEVLERV